MMARNFVMTMGICIGLLAWLTAAPVSSAKPPSTEYAVKAAFLYQFSKFVDWPAAVFAYPPNVFIIGVIGEDPFKDEIDFLKGKEAKERPVEVRYIDDMEAIKDCRILFIGRSEEERLGRIVRLAEKFHVLTVADTTGYADSGVMINLIGMVNKIGFEINLNSARRAEITISSHLLKLAKIVGTEPTNS